MGAEKRLEHSPVPGEPQMQQFVNDYVVLETLVSIEQIQG